jgi:hypothetical protein
MQIKLLGTINADFDLIDQRVIKFSTAHQLLISFKKAYDSVRREVIYNVLIEFGIPRKLAGLIKCV